MPASNAVIAEIGDDTLVHCEVDVRRLHRRDERGIEETNTPHRNQPAERRPKAVDGEGYSRREVAARCASGLPEMVRIEISRERPTARARRRLATLAQAMRRTKATAHTGRPEYQLVSVSLLKRSLKFWTMTSDVLVRRRILIGETAGNRTQLAPRAAPRVALLARRPNSVSAASSRRSSSLVRTSGIQSCSRPET